MEENELDGTMHHVIDTYRLFKMLGQGAMGSVFAAVALDGSPHPLKTGDRVAIKILHPHLTRHLLGRFEVEQQALEEMSKLNGHPNIPKYFAHGWAPAPHGGRLYYIVIEYLEGQSLADILDTVEKVDFRTALQIWRSVILAADYAHGLGILHRDIKPDNIFMCKDGPPHTMAKLLDFGIARWSRQQERRALTNAGYPVGTPRYMSPEQFMHTSRIGPASDVFALGCLGYRLFAKEDAFPYDAPGKAATVRLPNAAPPVRPPGMDVGLWAIISRAMALKIEDRYPSALELLKALDDYCGILTTPRAPSDHATAAAVEIPATMVMSPEQAAIPLGPYRSYDPPAANPSNPDDDEDLYERLPPWRARAAKFFGMTTAFLLAHLIWILASPFILPPLLPLLARFLPDVAPITVPVSAVNDLITRVVGDGGVSTTTDASVTSDAARTAPPRPRAPRPRPPTLELRLPGGQVVRPPVNDGAWDSIQPAYQQMICYQLRRREASGSWMDEHCPSPSTPSSDGFGGSSDRTPYGGFGNTPSSGGGYFPH